MGRSAAPLPGACESARTRPSFLTSMRSAVPREGICDLRHTSSFARLPGGGRVIGSVISADRPTLEVIEPVPFRFRTIRWKLIVSSLFAIGIPLMVFAYAMASLLWYFYRDNLEKNLRSNAHLVAEACTPR
ncbi:MAG: hypothetical protein K0Q72_4242 [Armatimonadetes bacterium]|nr:hypothetical protein [Armatimonadota bacterium]